MNCLRIVSCLALAGKLASGRDGADGRSDAPNAAVSAEPRVMLGTAVRLPQVLKKLEPTDNRVVKLPGPAVTKRAPAPVEATMPPVVPPAGGTPVAPSAEASVPHLTAKPNGLSALTAKVPTVDKPSYVLPVWRPVGVPKLPSAPEVAAVRPYPPPSYLNALVSRSFSVPPPRLIGGTIVLPSEFVQESAVFCQKQIGQWSLAEARAIFGEPVRQRPAIDEEDAESGHIFAFRDPTGRYKELELDFGNEKGALRTVFVYPWNLTWQECRRLWGAKVTSTEGNKGRMFYSYVNRHLDVLVDRDGKVISLGLY